MILNPNLRPGVVELAGLPDRESPGPEDQHLFGRGGVVLDRRGELPVDGLRDGLGGALPLEAL